MCNFTFTLRPFIASLSLFQSSEDISSLNHLTKMEIKDIRFKYNYKKIWGDIELQY